MKTEQSVLLRGRVKALDTARGFATIMMVFGHYIEWYLKSETTPSLLHYIFVTILGISAQNLFVTLPAIGVVLQHYIYRKRGMEEAIVKKLIIKRGILLILFQFFCNALFMDPVYTWNWFILSFIGVSIIISYFLSKLSHLYRIIIVICIFILSPFLKFYFYSIFYEVIINSNSWSIDVFLYKMLLQIVFPIFPSIIYPILGTIFADGLIKGIENKTQFKFIQKSLFLGIFLLFSYFVLQNFYTLINFPDFLLNLPSRLDILYVFGTVLLIISIFYFIQDLYKKDWKVFKPLEILGYISLTVFITHFYLFPKLFEYLYPARRNTNFYSIMEFSMILVIFYLIYGLWVKRNQRKYSIEWLLRSLI
ncbi:MAG: heparan-alpha-glucosaminide N-acetyltransferase domain-containing protein [Candidatus Helarchaeota archaeon]